MKKFIASVCAIAMAATILSVPAKADNSEEVIIGVLGGALGGLIIGEVLARPRYAPAPIYVQPAPVYVEPEYIHRCFSKWVKVFDPNRDQYIKVQRRVCDWVPAY